MKALSVDLKEKILKALERGETISATAKFFSVSRPIIHRLLRDVKAGKGLEHKRGRKIGSAHKVDEALLIKLYTEDSDLYHEEASKILGCSVRAVGMALQRLGFSRKKEDIYQESCLEKQKEFIKELIDIPEENRVYMDESGVHARDGERSYGYSLKGVRLIQEKSGKDKQNNRLLLLFVKEKCLRLWSMRGL
jgi:transposase